MEKGMEKGVEDMSILRKREDHYDSKTASKKISKRDFDVLGIQQVRHLLDEPDTVRKEIGKEKEMECVIIQGKRKNYATDGDTDSKDSKKSFKQVSDDLGEVQHILNELEAQRASVSATKQPQKVTDDHLSSCGLRFKSSEQFLVDYFLRNKNLGKPLDYCHPMSDVDVYSTHPQDLMDKYTQSCEKVWYFFMRSRPNENQRDTHWILGRKKDIFNKEGVKIGVKQLYVYCENNCKTHYKVVEYQLDSAGEDDLKNGPWFLCKIYKNRAKGEPKISSGYTKKLVYPDPASYDDLWKSMLQEERESKEREIKMVREFRKARELSSSGQLYTVRMKMGKEKEVKDVTVLGKRKNYATDGDIYAEDCMKSSKQDSDDLGEVQHILNEPEAQLASVSATKPPQKVTDDHLSSCGLRFNSSEQFLVDYFLRNKNLGKPLDYCHPMSDVDVYSTHPQDLMDKHTQSCEKVWYFFTRSRPNESQTGTHLILGRKKDIFNKEGAKIGVKQLYAYCENNCKTQYKIVEYQLDPAGEDGLKNGPWFLCKLYKNRAKGEPKISSGYTKRLVYPVLASYDDLWKSMLQEERESKEREIRMAREFRKARELSGQLC